MTGMRVVTSARRLAFLLATAKEEAKQLIGEKLLGENFPSN
jgi:hypothetical protein